MYHRSVSSRSSSDLRALLEAENSVPSIMFSVSEKRPSSN
ncbi:hypothetical protein T12_9543 [Trichinella patagoniensis]|uniref:Uncharacterized protein n=1 Tax=Trichinella patagoniensis TaxID=990121 RepID=A0A0V0YZM5_9BILA|nr:hypothetical protein T12_9543 [Trichinella patagoniensis]